MGLNAVNLEPTTGLKLPFLTEVLYVENIVVATKQVMLLVNKAWPTLKGFFYSQNALHPTDSKAEDAFQSL